MVEQAHKVVIRGVNLAALLFAAILLISAVSCQTQGPSLRITPPAPPVSISQPLPPGASPELTQLVDSAIAQTKVTTGYDPSYSAIDYPGGDVAPETGVCSDVIVRGFRKAGVDLQKEIHEDMGQAWSEYSRRWGAKGRDRNIDHRRVLNLMKYFERKNKALPITTNRDDYKPGDIVAWKLSEGVEHVGLMVNEWSEPAQGYLIVHNIGAGAQLQDVLFSWEIIGHYRYFER